MAVERYGVCPPVLGGFQIGPWCTLRIEGGGRIPGTFRRDIEIDCSLFLTPILEASRQSSYAIGCHWDCPMSSPLARWQERLQNLTVSPLTRDYPEPSHTESEKRPIEAFQSLELSQEAQHALTQLQITDGAQPHTNFAILLTALVILVSRLTGDENICLGTSGQKGRPFVLRTAVDASESFVKLLSKIEKVQCHSWVPYPASLY